MLPPPPPPKPPMRQFISAQLMTAEAALSAFGHAPARHACRQLRLMPLKGMRQPIAHVTVPMHVSTLQGPQSAGQLAHVSSGPQTPSPHVEHTPQSAGQVAHVSGAVQTPSPQPLQTPQSFGQL
jgi:hypothetical protein